VDINDAIANLAQSRRELDDERSAWDALQDEINDRFGDRVAMIDRQLRDAKSKVAEDESVVRTTALAMFDGEDKHPHPAVTIKVYTAVDYNDADAIALARDVIPGALRIDKSAFEKAVKGLAGMDIEGVSDKVNAVVVIRDDPRATIARDLGGY